MELALLFPANRQSYKFGSGEEGAGCEDMVHNDTLFGAICSNYRFLYGPNALESFLGEASQGKGLRLSSAFHGLEINELDDDGHREFRDRIYFFPRPMIDFNLDEKSESKREARPKSFKKIRYISQSVLEKVQRGKSVSFGENLVIDDSYLLAPEDYGKLGLRPYLGDSDDQRLRACLARIRPFSFSDERRAHLDRVTGSAFPYPETVLTANYCTYFVGENEFLIKPFFYFLFDSDPDSAPLRVKAAVRLIADQGLGGDRTTGSGLFEEISFRKPSWGDQLGEEGASSGTDWINLSLVLPRGEEVHRLESFMLAERSAYVNDFQGGVLLADKIRMVQEGAIFQERARGQIRDVAPKDVDGDPGPLYKHGLGLYLPLTTNGGGG